MSALQAGGANETRDLRRRLPESEDATDTGYRMTDCGCWKLDGELLRSPGALSVFFKFVATLRAP